MDLSKLIDADKLGGWIRAWIASLLATVVAKNPVLSTYLDPITQGAIATAIAGVAVGWWSHITKTDAAKVQMAAALPEVKEIKVSDPKLESVAPEVTVTKGSGL